MARGSRPSQTSPEANRVHLPITFQSDDYSPFTGKRMNWQSIDYIWPVLLLLGYLLVTAVLTVVTYERKKHIDLHNRVRESLHMRNAYFQHLAQRMRGDD